MGIYTVGTGWLGGEALSSMVADVGLSTLTSRAGTLAVFIGIAALIPRKSPT